MSRIFIYGLRDPRSMMIRYVGKTNTGMRRPLSHAEKQCLDIERNTHKVNWIRSLLKLGLMYEVVVLEHVSIVADLDSAERKWIRWGREAGVLVNLTDGGTGGPQPPEVIEKMRRSQQARWERAGEREKARASWNKPGRRELQVDITREMMRKRIQDPVALDQLVANGTRLGKSNIGKKRSDASRARMSVVQRALAADPRVRERMVEGQRKRLADPADHERRIKALSVRYSNREYLERQQANCRALAEKMKGVQYNRLGIDWAVQPWEQSDAEIGRKLRVGRSTVRYNRVKIFGRPTTRVNRGRIAVSAETRAKMSAAKRVRDEKRRRRE